MRVLRKILGLPVWLLGFTFLLAVVVGNYAAPMFSKSINIFLGFPTYSVEGGTGEQYFESSYATPEEQYEAAVRLARTIEQEGIVLMRNEGDALPLASGSRVTLLGQDSVDFVYGGAGSGSVDASSASTLRESLEQAGLVVNPVAWEFYEDGPGSEYRKVVPDITGSGGFAVNEDTVHIEYDSLDHIVLHDRSRAHRVVHYRDPVSQLIHHLIEDDLKLVRLKVRCSYKL